MKSLVEASRAADYPAEIVLVASNRPEAPGLGWAEKQGLRTAVVDHKLFPSREAFEASLQGVLEEHGVELIALAGFMRLMTPAFVERWRDRMINIHPSLLPSFKGLNTHARALEAGVKIAGCTVHFVRAEMDEGPIIAQAAVRVLPGDDPETLAARVLETEHRVYPAALRLVAAGSVQSKDQKVTINQHSGATDALFSPAI